MTRCWLGVCLFECGVEEVQQEPGQHVVREGGNVTQDTGGGDVGTLLGGLVHEFIQGGVKGEGESVA